MSKIAIDTILKEISQRIISLVHPTKIVLFGSAVRGDMHANSDIDLLVIVPSGTHRRKTAQKIYRGLIGIGFATDIIVVTESDIDEFKNNDGMIIRPALEDGKVLYAA